MERGRWRAHTFRTEKSLFALSGTLIIRNTAVSTSPGHIVKVAALLVHSRLAPPNPPFNPSYPRLNLLEDFPFNATRDANIQVNFIPDFACSLQKHAK